MLKKLPYKKILSALSYLFLAFIVVITIGVVVDKVRGEVPDVFGFSILHITTGSMEDEIMENSYVLIRKCDADDVGEDDIITFYSPDPSIYGMLNTHRIVSVKEENGERVFITKGDANLTEDTYPVPEERLVGRYVKTLTFITSLTSFFQTQASLIVIVILWIVLIGMMAFNLIHKIKEEGKEDKQ